MTKPSQDEKKRWKCCPGKTKLQTWMVDFMDSLIYLTIPNKSHFRKRNLK